MELQALGAARITMGSLFLELSCSVNTFRTFVLTGCFLQVFDSPSSWSGFRKIVCFPTLASQ